MAWPSRKKNKIRWGKGRPPFTPAALYPHLIHPKGAKRMEIQVRRRIVGPYDNTTYVLVCAGSNESLIVDCPLPNEEAIVEQATGTNVRGILLTHGHGDHLASLVAVKRHFNVPVHM